jgi:hypothetical protein
MTAAGDTRVSGVGLNIPPRRMPTIAAGSSEPRRNAVRRNTGRSSCRDVRCETLTILASFSMSLSDT